MCKGSKRFSINGWGLFSLCKEGNSRVINGGAGFITQVMLSILLGKCQVP